MCKFGGKFEKWWQDPGDLGQDHGDGRGGAGEVPAGRAGRPLRHLLHGGRQLNPTLGPRLSCTREKMNARQLITVLLCSIEYFPVPRMMGGIFYLFYFSGGGVGMFLSFLK